MLLCTFSMPVAGTFSFDAQIWLEWVVGQAIWNSVIYGKSLSSNSWDVDCLYGAFECNQHLNATHGTDCLMTHQVLYVRAGMPIHF